MSKFWATSDSSDSEESSCASEDDVQSAPLSSVQEEDMSLDQDAAWASIESDQVFVDPQKVVQQTLPKSCYTRIVCMSDTHGKHREVFVPQGDVLIHGGDFTMSGEIGTVQDLSEMFGELDFEQTICIAGNHELTFQPQHYDRVWARFHPSPFNTEQARKALFNCTFLQDSSCVVGNDIEVYGSPWQPEFFNWAFNLERGQPLRDVWAKIPTSIDVLVTHGPPLGRGDICQHGGRAGCYDLLNEVQTRVKPRVHVFGHVHEGFGVSSDGTTLFVNASNLSSSYEVINPCIVIDLPHDKTLQPMLVVPKCKIATKEELVEWLESKKYNELAGYIESVSSSRIKIGDDLFDDFAYYDLVEELGLFRDVDAAAQLRRALSQLYAESYES